MQRCIVLQIDGLTRHKDNLLKQFNKNTIDLASHLLKQRKSTKLMDLHNTTYSESKKTTSFHSQVICDIERNVVKSKGNVFKNITIKFNVPRNCKTFETKTKFFVKLGTYPRNDISIPIKQNKNFERFTELLKNGWDCKTYGLVSNRQIVAYLSKKDIIFPEKPNILGIDINLKYFAVSIISPKGKVLKQTYFGKDIWVKRKKIFERRKKLQSLADKGNHRAKQSLKKMKHKEKNFVKNRLGEIVKDITNLALKYNADISIEKLKKFKPINRKTNKKIFRIPFYQFKQVLENRCFDKEINLNIVDSWNTSKWCTHCGTVGNGHDSNYSLFKCKCGQVVNSDRKASLAIAVKSLVERNKSLHNTTTDFIQISTRRVPVNGLLRSNNSVLGCVVHNTQSPMESSNNKPFE